MVRGVQDDAHEELLIVGVVLFGELLGRQSSLEGHDQIVVVSDVCREDHLYDDLADVPVLGFG